MATILTALVCLFAVILTTARIVVAIPFFEDQVTTFATQSGAKVEGFEGGWHGFDPYLRIQKASFPFGSAHEIFFQIDIIESLYRGQAVAKRLHVKNLEIFFEQPDNVKDTRFPIEEWVQHALFLNSDEIYVETLGLAIQTAQRSHYFVGSFRSKAIAGNQAIRADLTSLTCQDCMVHVALDLEQIQFPIVNHFGTVEINVKDFPIHPELLGMAQLPESSMSMEFHGHKNAEHFDGEGSIEIQIGTEQQNTLQAELLVSDFGGLSTAEIRDFTVHTPAQSFSHNPIFIREYVDGSVIWTEEIDISMVTALVTNVMKAGSDIYDWMAGLNPRGLLVEPVLLVDDEVLAIGGTFKHVAFDAHKDVPSMAVDAATVSGDLAFPRFHVEDADLRIHLSKQFNDAWHFQNTQGDTQFHFGSDHLAIHVAESTAEDGEVTISNQLGFSRDLNSTEYSVTNINAANISALAKTEVTAYLPVQVGPDLADWLQEHIRHITFGELAFTHHYYQALSEQDRLNVVDLTLDFTEGFLDYQTDWPPLRDAAGQLKVNTQHVRVDLAQGSIWDTPTNEGSVYIPFSNDTISIGFELDTQPNDLVQLVLATELGDYFPFVQNSWVGTGRVGLQADLVFSYADDFRLEDLNIVFDLNGVHLGETVYELYFDDLAGTVTYEFPHTLQAQGLSGSMFGRPLQVDIWTQEGEADDLGHRDHTLMFALEGEANDHDVYQLINLDGTEFSEGTLPFNALLRVYAEGEQDPTLTVQTDLVGLDIELPAPLTKEPGTAWDTEVEMVFQENQIAIDFRSPNVQGWIDHTDATHLTGIVNIGLETPVRDSANSQLVFTGSLAEWHHVPSVDSSSMFSNLALQDLKIKVLQLGEFPLHNVTVDGVIQPETYQLQLTSDEASGSIGQANGQLTRIHLTELNLQSRSSEDATAEQNDPLQPSVVPWLVPMHITLDDVKVVDANGVTEDYGEWDMKLHPSEGGVTLTDLTGTIKGLHIETSGEGFWDIKRNVSQFEVAVSGSDLGEVLSAWGYDTQMQSERFELRGNLFWPGSPLGYQLESLSGSFTATSRDGRFYDIGTNPALRLVSLLNISTIADRLQLDFGDVLLKGYAYEDISLGAIADHGVLQLSDPMRIKGRSSELRMLGSVNMENEAINLEVIATLPLNKALPWYSAALSLSNPIVGVGLLIGTTTLENPIRQMTSGRYSVQGTLTDPDVSFMGIFDTSLSDSSELRLPEEQTTGDAPIENEVNGVLTAPVQTDNDLSQ